MITKRILLLPACVAVLLGACSQEAGNTSTKAANSPDTPSSIRIENFALGTALGPHGGIAEGATQYAFEPSERVYVAMELKHAPAGTPIHVVWRGPGNEVLGQETKRVRPGQRFMNFAADGSSLPPGENYGVEISVNGIPLTHLYFDLLVAVE